MRIDNEALVLDMLEWLAAGPRPYGDVMEAWRSTCPRLTVWEDALDLRLVRQRGGAVEATPAGRALLAARGRPVRRAAP